MFVGGAVSWLSGDGSGSASQRRLTDDVDVVVDIAARTLPTLQLRRPPSCAWFRRGHERRRSRLPLDRSIGRHGGRHVRLIRIRGLPNRWYAEAIANTPKLLRSSGPHRSDHLARRTSSRQSSMRSATRRRGDYRRQPRPRRHHRRRRRPAHQSKPTSGPPPATVREFIGERFRSLLADPKFVDAVAGHLSGDSASQARLPLVLTRMRSIANAALELVHARAGGDGHGHVGDRIQRVGVGGVSGTVDVVG